MPPPTAPAGSSLDTLETRPRAARAESPEFSDPAVTATVQAMADAIGEFLPDAQPSPPSAAYSPIQTPPNDAEDAFWHSGWKGTRARLLASFERTGQGKHRIDAFRCCGGETWVMRHKTDGTHRLRSNRCHDRLCINCQRARSRLMSGNVRKALTARHYLHVVLTLKHSDAPLRSQIDRIYACFRKLRSKRVWKDHAAGGAAFCEITRDDQRGQWHVHIHCIAQARFIPVKDYDGTGKRAGRTLPGLSSTWLAVTGDSPVVWCRTVHDRDAAAAEVAKYVTKPLSLSVFRDDDALDELVTALKGRRLCMTFGTWHKIKLSERNADWNPADWVPVCTLEQLQARAAGGEILARDLITLFSGAIQCLPRPPPAQGRLYSPPGPPPVPCAVPA